MATKHPNPPIVHPIEEMFTADAADSPEAEFVRAVLAAGDEYRRATIAAATDAEMRTHQRAGRRMGPKTHCPYGTRPDPNDPAMLAPDPREQPHLATIRDLAESGKGARAIARHLDDAGVATRGGAPWRHATIQRILRRAAPMSEEATKHIGPTGPRRDEGD